MIKLSGHMKTLVAVLKSPETARSIEDYCAAANDIEADIRLVDATLSSAPGIVNGGADIVIVETGAEEGDSVAALEQLCAHVTRGGSFIALIDNPSGDAVPRLFRAGVTDVLSTPPSAAELSTALDAARGRPAVAQTLPPGETGKIIVVLKSAGGVGATSTTVNLAAAFASIQPGLVAAVDLDIQFGQIATALDQTPRMNILDAIRAGGRLDATLLTSILHAHPSGVSLLAAPNTTTPLEAVNDRFIDRLFTQLRTIAAVSIVEMPTAWTQWVGDAIGAADHVLIVAESSVRSAAGAARIAQSIIDFGLDKLHPSVAINKFEKTIENTERAKRIGDIFRTKPIGAIRLDSKAATEAADRGLLFRDAAPKSIAVKDFETLARRLAAALGVETQEETKVAAPLDRLLPGRFGSRSRMQ